MMAVTGIPSSLLFEMAVQALAAGPRINTSAVLQLTDDGLGLHLRAMLGFHPGIARGTTLVIEPDAYFKFTLANDGPDPIAVYDFENESRFRRDAILVDHSIRSAAGVVIQGSSGPWGILVGCSREPRLFSQDDLTFLSTVASIAAKVIEHEQYLATQIKTRDELNLALNLKEEFIAALSHELKQPVSAIQSGAQILAARSDTLNSEQRDIILGELVDQAQRLTATVESIFEAYRPAMGQEIESEPVVLERVIHAAVSHLHRTGKRRRVRINLPDALPLVAASRSHVEVVLRNLLVNAEKYTGSPSGIEVTAEASERQVIVRVLDHGPGVREGDLNRIMARFERGTSETPADGLGLGLAICRKIIEVHGGRIWLENRREGGLCASFSLPVYEPEQDPFTDE
jgi:K+-sensing histidine kinase KdpD